MVQTNLKKEMNKQVRVERIVNVANETDWEYTGPRTVLRITIVTEIQFFSPAYPMNRMISMYFIRGIPVTAERR